MTGVVGVVLFVFRNNEPLREDFLFGQIFLEHGKLLLEGAGHLEFPVEDFLGVAEVGFDGRLWILNDHELVFFFLESFFHRANMLFVRVEEFLLKLNHVLDDFVVHFFEFGWGVLR